MEVPFREPCDCENYDYQNNACELINKAAEMTSDFLAELARLGIAGLVMAEPPCGDQPQSGFLLTNTECSQCWRPGLQAALEQVDTEGGKFN